MRRYINVFLIFLLLFASGLADAQLRFSPGGVGPQGDPGPQGPAGEDGAAGATGPPGGGDGVEFDGTTHAEFLTFLGERTAEETVVLPASLTFGSWTEVVIDKPLKFRGEGRKKVTWTGPGGVDAFSIQADVVFDNIAFAGFDDIFTFQNSGAKLDFARFIDIEIDDGNDGVLALTASGLGVKELVIRDCLLTNMRRRGMNWTAVCDNMSITNMRIFTVQNPIENGGASGIRIGDSTTASQDGINNVNIFRSFVWDVDANATGEAGAVGISVKARNIAILNCDIRRISNNGAGAAVPIADNSDAEGIYTKGEKVLVEGNYLEDACDSASEASLNLKGTLRVGGVANQPIGSRVICIGNHVVENAHTSVRGIVVAAEDSLVMGNTLQNLSDYGIATDAGDTSNIIITKNIFYNCINDGINLSNDGPNTIVSENIMRHQGNPGTGLSQIAGIRAQGFDGVGLIISNNLIDIQNTNISGAEYAGITIKNCAGSGYRIFGNKLIANNGAGAGSGISMINATADPTNVEIYDNDVSGCGSDAIFFSGSFTDEELIANEITIAESNAGYDNPGWEIATGDAGTPNAAPTVGGRNGVYIIANTGVFDVTGLTGGKGGVVYSFLFADANTTLKVSGSFRTKSGADLNPLANTIYQFRKHGSLWYEQ